MRINQVVHSLAFSCQSCATAVWVGVRNRLVSIIQSSPTLIKLAQKVSNACAIVFSAIKKYTHYRRDRNVAQFVQELATVWENRSAQFAREQPTIWENFTPQLSDAVVGPDAVFGSIIKFIPGKEGYIPGEGSLIPREEEIPDMLELDLSRKNLTDEHLKHMAQSGRFRDLQILTLRGNPRLTGRGMAFLTTSGFEKLEVLNVEYNKHILREGLDEWLACDGLPSLKVLYLAVTDVRPLHLEQMIERAAWFRRLEGLRLCSNPNLISCPRNILRLTNLKEHGIDHEPPITFYPRKGLIFAVGGEFDRGRLFSKAPEALVLLRAGRIYGGMLPLPRKYSFRHVCQVFKVPLPEEDSPRMDALREACKRYRIPFDVDLP